MAEFVPQPHDGDPEAPAFIGEPPVDGFALKVAPPFIGGVTPACPPI